MNLQEMVEGESAKRSIDYLSQLNPFTFSLTVMTYKRWSRGESKKDLSAIVYKTIESFHTFFYSYKLTRDGQG